MIDKKFILIIGNDIHNISPKLFVDFKCHEYEGFFVDEVGSKRNMDYWSGDKFFGNYMEIFYFFGIDEEEPSSKCEGLKIWFREYSKFNKEDEDFWMQVAQESGYPKSSAIFIQKFFSFSFKFAYSLNQIFKPLHIELSSSESIPKK